MSRALALAVVVAAACGSAPVNDETRAREDYLRGLAEREGLTDAWHLMTRSDLVFEDGFSLTSMAKPDDDRRWIDLEQAVGSMRAVAVRWMTASGHLRVRGRGDMHLRVWGRIHVLAISTRPRVTVTFAGLEIDSRIVEPDGTFALDTVIPGTWLHGWSDVYVNLSSMHEPWRTVKDLRIARLEGVVWEPLP